MIHELNERTRQILRMVIDAYVETGEPVGSKLISERLGMKLSPATIRSAMGELEALGLLYSPHTSAGRLPTDSGLTVFVEGLMEVRDIAADDRLKIERSMAGVKGHSVPEILEQTSSFLSGLSSCAGLVLAPKAEGAVKQIEFVLLSPGRALAVIVPNAGAVENRVVEVPRDITAGDLRRAANYINAHIADKTLPEAARIITDAQLREKAELDTLTAKVVEAGIASLAPQETGGHFFVRGQAHLLEDVTAIEDLSRIRGLFEALEEKEIGEKTNQVQQHIGGKRTACADTGCNDRDEQQPLVGGIVALVDGMDIAVQGLGTVHVLSVVVLSVIVVIIVVVICGNARHAESALQGFEFSLMECREMLQVARTGTREVHFHLAAVRFALLANHQPCFLATRQQCHRAVMLQLQPFRQFAHRGPVAAGKTAHMEQQQVLQRCQSFLLCRSFTEMQEASQLIAEFRQRFVLLLLQPSRSFCCFHH